jgi:TldD protein
LNPSIFPKSSKKALKNGGDFAELYADDTESLQIIAEQKKLEKVNPAIDRGVGLRVMWGEKTAYGFTNDIREKSLLELADSVSSAVKAGAFDKDIALRAVPPHLLHTIKKPPRDLDMQKKRALIERGEKAAWAADPKIKQVKVLYGEISKKVTIANSLGQLAKDDRTYSLYFVQVVAQKPGHGRLTDGLSPRRGIDRTGILGRPGDDARGHRQNGDVPGPLDVERPQGPRRHDAGGPLQRSGRDDGHEAVGHGLEADLAGEGLSVYHNKVGQKIAGDRITVVDDATLAQQARLLRVRRRGGSLGKNRSHPDGVLMKYMSDRRMSSKHGFSLTGNGRPRVLPLPPHLPDDRIR